MPSLTRLIFQIFIGSFFLLAAVSRAQDVKDVEAEIKAVASDGPVRKIAAADGRNTGAWEIAPQQQLHFQTESPLKVPASGVIYAEITYLDLGYGRLGVFGKTADGQEVKSDKHTRVVLSDTKRWVTSMQRIGGLKAGEPAEFFVRMERNPDGRLAIAKGKIRTAPFKDPIFNYLLNEPWKRPYDGPTAPDLANGTLKGKIMVGYQGWYRTPNDPYDQGWNHWGDINNGKFSIDMWPDVSAYAPETLDKAADIKTISGKTAYLFSSAWPHTMRLHFSWMRKHQIDGAFLQRFVSDGAYAVNGRQEWVMGNVRDAANREGRIWAIEYDISGCPDDKLLDFIKKDWAWLIDDFGLKSDKAYARENGKLVVFVWGLAVGGREITPKTAEAVFEFLKHDPKYGGNYVIGGMPGNWRDLGPEWQNHIKQQDATLAWMSSTFEKDVADFKALGIDYFPHVKPGFSWSNLKHIPTGATDAYTPRQGGKYYEEQLDKIAASGADRLFIGMYDEYDESTAIIPMSDDPPPTPSRPGVNVKIFNKDRWEGRAVQKTIPQLDLDLPAGSPGRDLPETGYSAILDGTIRAPKSGLYRFSIEAPEGSRADLKIGDKELKIEGFPANGSEELAVDLKADELTPYQIEYVHGSTPGKIQVFWQAPQSPRELVPATALIDAWGRFITNEGKPADHWLKLTGDFKKKLLDAR